MEDIWRSHQAVFEQVHAGLIITDWDIETDTRDDFVNNYTQTDSQELF